MDYMVRPFIPYAAFDWLSSWLEPDMRVFEYGSGNSTVWFSQNASEVCTVENCYPFFIETQGNIKEHGNGNVIYALRGTGESYSKLIHEYEGQFDLVFVDGRFRREYMEECYDKAKYAIFLDNSDAGHYLDAYEVMQSYTNGEIIDFVSLGIDPSTGKELPDPNAEGEVPLAWKASVFLKEI